MPGGGGDRQIGAGHGAEIAHGGMAPPFVVAVGGAQPGRLRHQFGARRMKIEVNLYILSYNRCLSCKIK
jgi:hypothetical protein